MSKILEELIVKYKQSEGDSIKKRVLYSNLVYETLKLVKKIAAGFNVPSSIGKDDLIQVGAIGVLKAIDNYDLNVNGSFKTYVSKFIKGKILQYLRDYSNTVRPPRDANEEETNNIKNIISLDQSVFSDDGQETLLDRVQDNNYDEIYENKKLIEYALNKLPQNERGIIYKFYIEGITKKEIAQEENISATHVARIIKRALQKMYQYIEMDLKEE